MTENLPFVCHDISFFRQNTNRVIQKIVASEALIFAFEKKKARIADGQ
jgi:hypothetical protein